jgi:hypothetical protein
MKRILATAILVTATVWVPAVAQSGSKTLASTMNVYVFPTQGQDASQQSQNEAECYNWAVGNTGTDPFELQKQAQDQQHQAEMAQQQAKQAGKGAGARGAIGGAAGGALIGEIVSDDPGRGAAYGAAAGAIIGRRQRKKAQHQATAQVENASATAQASTAVQLENFKKAFAVCLEANDYMVKF